MAETLAGTLLEFMGYPQTPELLAQANLHLSLTANEAAGYTRGRGFTYDPATSDWDVPGDLLWVIVGAAARSLSNPTHDRRVEAGSYSSLPGSFAGWSLNELAVLRRYRRVAA